MGGIHILSLRTQRVWFWLLNHLNRIENCLSFLTSQKLSRSDLGFEKKKTIQSLMCSSCHIIAHSPPTLCTKFKCFHQVQGSRNLFLMSLQCLLIFWINYVVHAILWLLQIRRKLKWWIIPPSSWSSWCPVLVCCVQNDETRLSRD